MNALMISALPTLFGLLVKGTALLLAAWLICLCLCRTSAAVRHLVWTAALGGILLLPILSVSLPRWDVAFGYAVAIPAAVSAQAAAVLLNTSAPEAVDKASSQTVTIPQQTADEGTASASYSITSYFFPLALAVGLLIWLIGFIGVLSQLFAGLRRIGEVRCRSLPLENLPLAAAEEVRQTFCSDHVEFFQVKAHDVAVPVTWGLHRPTVLLPAQSASWSKECLRAALLHELAHVQRRDWLTQTVARFICALYWWHPLVWLAAKQAREESERACDDLVLGTGVKAADYAQRLVEVVRSLPAGSLTRTVAVAMAQPSEVEGRVKAVLATGKDRSHLSQRRLAFTVMMLGSLLLPLSTLRPVLRAAAAGQTRLTSGEFKRHPVIVVDPGHGGQDTGAVGASGVTEKALNLEIAQQLRTELERRGAVVFLTRDSDTFVPLPERSQFAAQRHADYFVSLHCEVWANRPDQVAQKSEGTGTAVFFHGQNPKQRQLAQSIGLGIGQATALPPSKVVSDATRFVTGFAVLRGAQMPAALVECGYLNTPQGLSRLQDLRQQQRLAEGIAAGLVAVQVKD